MSLEGLRREFEEALEGLKEVHTQEELDAQKKKVNRLKERMLQEDEQFRLRFQQRQEAMRIRNLMSRAGSMRDVRRKLTMTPVTRVAHLPKDEVILVCPECLATNVNWLKVNRKTARKLKLPKKVKSIPWCFRCKKRMVRMAREKIKELKRKRMEK